MMKRKPLLAVVGVAIAIAPLGAAHAHHSFAMFDQAKEVVMTGVVKEFQWTNPHTWVQVEVNQNGKPVVWSVEGGSPNGLRRQGWTSATFKAGDRINITINPLKNGEAGGSFVRATLPNGKTIGRAPGSTPPSR